MNVVLLVVMIPIIILSLHQTSSSGESVIELLLSLLMTLESITGPGTPAILLMMDIMITSLHLALQRVLCG